MVLMPVRLLFWYFGCGWWFGLLVLLETISWVASLLVGYIIYDVVAVGGWVAFGCLSVGLCFW